MIGFILCLFVFFHQSMEYCVKSTTNVNLRNKVCGTAIGRASTGQVFEVEKSNAGYGWGLYWYKFKSGEYAAKKFFISTSCPSKKVCMKATQSVNVRDDVGGNKLFTAYKGQIFEVVDDDAGEEWGLTWMEFTENRFSAKKYFTETSCDGGSEESSDREFIVSNPSDYCFPVYSGFNYNRDNWGQRRKKSNFYGRCHAGVDLITHGEKNLGSIQTITDGQVIKVTKTFYKCRGGKTDNTQVGTYEYVGQVQIYNSKLDKTFVYGEINKDTINVKTGQYVPKAFHLGIASKCVMLHFEVFDGKGRENLYGSSKKYQGTTRSGWYLYDSYGFNELKSGSNVCRDDPRIMGILDDVGSKLMDPSKFLKQIAGNNCNSIRTA